MPYNMFLEISVFFGRLLFKMLFIGLITYTKIGKLPKTLAKLSG